MHTEIKTQWIDALRSGRYVQGQLRLRNYDNSYCCLGVLADVFGVFWEMDDHVAAYVALFPPTPGRTDRPGYMDTVPETLMTREAQGMLIEMNDGHAWTFDAIADWIDGNIIVDETGCMKERDDAHYVAERDGTHH